MAVVRAHEIPTIDVNLVTVQENILDAPEYALDTASKIAVEPQMNEQEAVQLVVKQVLKAQKKAASTLTGNQITLTDNVFTPELVLLLQGGEIKYAIDPETEEPTDEIIGYEPPAAGSAVQKKVFTLRAYSAVYDAAGNILKYERITYPNCTGQPIAFGSEDNVFRVQEYVIDSAPSTGDPAFTLDYITVDEFNAIITPVTP